MRSGRENRASTPQVSQSTRACDAPSKVSAMMTSGGASSLVLLKVEEEPMCMLTTVSVSWQAAHSGSQVSVCTLGRPSAAGFSEKARNATLGGAAPHLGRGQVRVPHRDEGERDQAAAGRIRAPFADHPVVAGPDAGQRQVAVAALEERLLSEPREGGEAQRRIGVIAVHVGQPGRPVITAGQDVVEQHGPVVRLPRGGS